MLERDTTKQNGLIDKHLKGSRFLFERRPDYKNGRAAKRYYDGNIHVKNSQLNYPIEIKIDNKELSESESLKAQYFLDNGIKEIIARYYVVKKEWQTYYYSGKTIGIDNNLAKALEQLIDNETNN